MAGTPPTYPKHAPQPTHPLLPAGSTKREPTVVGKPAEFMLANIADKFGLRREQVRAFLCVFLCALLFLYGPACTRGPFC